MTAIEHIIYRHGSGSGFENVSKFAAGTGAKDIKALVDSALRNGAVTANGKNAFTVEYNAGRVIGTAADGSDASRLRVHVRDGDIKTAFPY